VKVLRFGDFSLNSVPEVRIHQPQIILLPTVSFLKGIAKLSNSITRYFRKTNGFLTKMAVSEEFVL
jgi:hypothetical protein